MRKLNPVIGCLLSGSLVCGALILGHSASAQDALGGGRALDRNLGSGRINDRVPQENFAERNLIVTGDVAGGSEFRGRVGYRSVGDFRGTLGSDSFYDFERRSALSSIDYVNLARTSSQLRLGEGLGTMEYRRDTYVPPVGSVRYDSRELRLPQSFSNRVLPDRRLELQLDRDVLAQTTAGLYSSGTSDPRVVGVLRSNEGESILAEASPLLGLRFTAAEEDNRFRGLTLLDQARLSKDRLTGAPLLPGEPFRPSFEMLAMPEDRVPALPVDDRVGQETEQERYEGVLRRIAERYADEKDVQLDIDAVLMRGIDAEFDKLREELSRDSRDEQQQEADADVERQPRDEEDDFERSARPDRRETPDSGRPRDVERDEEIEPTGRIPSRIDPVEPERPVPTPDGVVSVPEVEPEESHAKPLTREELARLLRHNQTISKLAANSEDRFNELLTAGEQALRDGDYFLAERRFTRSLRIVPDHPLAGAGMTNAQLGAGVYLSAALTLRHLLTQHPEMIDTRYDKSLLPRDERLEAAVTNLRGRIDRNEELSEAGLLIAYIGHQTSRMHLVEEGLAAMLKGNPRDSLARLLGDIWLQDEATKSEGDAAQEAEPVDTPH